MKTNEEITYGKLKSLILDGELPAGEFLSQRMLAERTGAVVITVRSCLRSLENDGLIENVPKWGTRIPVDTPEKIEDRYFMRETLEIAALRKIREAAKDTHRLELLAAAAKCDAVTLGAPGSLRDFAAAHLEFHALFAKLSGSELLEKFLNQMNLRSMMHLNAQRGWLKGTDWANHHSGYVEALFALPLEAAEGKVREHMRNGKNSELEALVHNREHGTENFL